MKHLNQLLLFSAILCFCSCVNNDSKTSSHETDQKSSIASAPTEVKIGNQTWMSSNLNTDTFRNGEEIPEAKTIEEWEAGGPTWCYYEFNAANGPIHGKLYNWAAVNDPRGLAPEGWHIPSESEWIELVEYLGGEDSAPEKLKSTIGWEMDENGKNELGFSAYPSGYRNWNNLDEGMTYRARWWSTTSPELGVALSVGIQRSPYGWRMVWEKNTTLGLSVRCLKN